MVEERKRPYRIVHEPYLMEYLVRTYPPGTWRLNVRLGPVLGAERPGLKPAERRALKLWALSADAVVVLPDKCVIIEADIRGDIKKIGALLVYKEALLRDPDWACCHKKPIELVIVTPLDAPLLEDIASKYGIKVVKYTTDWLWSYIYTLPPRMRRGPGSRVKTK